MKKVISIILSICLCMQINMMASANELQKNDFTENSAVNNFVYNQNALQPNLIANTKLDILQTNAIFNKKFENTYFDGTRVENFSVETPDIKNLQEGTIIMKVKPKKTSGTIVSLGTGARLFNNDGKFRFDFEGFKANSLLISSDKYHTIAYSSEPSSDNKKLVKISVDGKTDTTGGVSGGTWRIDNTNKTFLGQVSTTASDILKIGAFGDDTDKFEGDIEYVTITQEVLTIDEMNEITAPNFGSSVFSHKDITVKDVSLLNKSEEIVGEDFTYLSQLEEATIIIKFEEDEHLDKNATLFSIYKDASNSFRIYINEKNQLCYILNNIEKTYPNSLNTTGFNTIALKADKENNTMKVFSNGKLIDTIANTSFIKDINPNKAYIGSFDNKDKFDGFIESINVYNKNISTKTLLDEEIIEITSQTEKPDIKKDGYLFYKGDKTGSDYFRIPSLYTTSKGTVVASIDARFASASDSPNNLDTTVMRSYDNGKTWDNPTLPNHFKDFPDMTGYKKASASFIDPVMVEDETTGRLFMLVDAFPGNAGIWGECSKEPAFDSQGNLKLRLDTETQYNYIAKRNSTGWYDISKTDGSITNYTLNPKLEVFENGNLLLSKQDGTNRLVNMNVFYKSSKLQVIGTSYLYMTHSDDEGKTWSEPTLLDGMLDRTGMNFLGVGPGRGIQLKNGIYKGRLIFPVYQFLHDTAGYTQRSALIYSDDGGTTWTRGDLVDMSNFSATNAYMSESVPVELPDGSIRLFGRTNQGKVGEVTSTDGGSTWVEAVTLVDSLPSNDCQVSAINYSTQIDGKPAIIFSAPEGPGRRFGGVISIGLISENGTYSNGSKKYDINWKYKSAINPVSEPFAYSSLTQLPNGDIMVLYESTGSNDVPYITFTIDQIKQIENIVYSDKNITITKSGNSNNAKRLQEDDINKLKQLEQGSIIIKFKETTSSSVGTLFGIANSTNDTGFHIYSNGDKICYQFLGGGNDTTYTNARANLNKNDFNTIAFKADKINKMYKIFSNGKLVASIPLSKYSFINNVPSINTAHLGTFQRPQGKNPYLFDGFIETIDIYDMPLDDDKLIEITSKTYKPIEQKSGILFYNGDKTDSEYFRIPALYKTKNGTVVSAIDARFGGTADSPNNLDTAVRTSLNNGATWLDATLPNHFIDYPDTGEKQLKSASFIDPVLVEDVNANNGKGRLFMLVDAFPSDTGLMGAKCEKGNGYKDGNLKLMWSGESIYNNVAIPDGKGGYEIHNPSGATGYTLNGKFELFNKGVPMTMLQKGSNNVKVPMNIFYEGAQFTVQKTSYLYLTYSDDQGKTWSDPSIINGMVKDDDMTFLGTGPGTGIQLKNGVHKGRLIFPVYQWENNWPTYSQRSALIYSDDGGITWTRGDFITVGEGFTYMSESVPVELPDGSVGLFGRTDGGKVGYAVSSDGGKTWQGKAILTDIPSPSCQVSAINYSKTIDGKPVILLAAPSNLSARKNGVIYAGLVNEDGTYEDNSKKYTIDFSKYKKDITGKEEDYAYSSLTELSNGNIMIFYEGNDLRNIPYKIMTINEITGKYEPIPSYPENNKPLNSGSGTTSSSGSSSSSTNNITNTNTNTSSWNDVIKNIKSSKLGSTITIPSTGKNNINQIPLNVFETLKNKEVTLNIDFKQYTIIIDGKNIGDIDKNKLNYTINIDSSKNSKISELTEGTDVMQFQLNNNLPFKLNIEIALSDKKGYLYYYDNRENKLKYVKRLDVLNGKVNFELNNTDKFILTNNIIKNSLVKDTEIKTGLIPYFKQNGINKIVGLSSSLNGNINFIAPITTIYEYKQNDIYFKDISNHWAKDSISFVSQRDLFSGTGNEEFSPNSGMTRGMFVTVIGRLNSIDVSEKAKFADVDNDKYYSPYINWASQNSIVTGTGDNNFSPDNQITREEMATMLNNYSKFMGFELQNNNNEINFSDKNNISSWAKDSIDIMQKAGILKGKNNNNFDPKATATRAEVSTLIQKFVEAVLN